MQELEETCYWMELLVEADIMPENRLIDLMSEANELLAIMTTCVKNVKNKGKQ